MPGRTSRQPFVLLLPPGVPATPALLQRFGLIRYDAALTGGRIANQYVRRILRPAIEDGDDRKP